MSNNTYIVIFLNSRQRKRQSYTSHIITVFLTIHRLVSATLVKDLKNPILAATQTINSGTHKIEHTRGMLHYDSVFDCAGRKKPSAPTISASVRCHALLCIAGIITAVNVHSYFYVYLNFLFNSNHHLNANIANAAF